MRETGKEISRRNFVVKVGLAIGAAAAVTAIPLLGQSKANAAQGDHAATEPKKKRAWVMVIDLKKCEGCATIGSPPQCTQSCINGHFVPEGQQWIEVFQVEPEGAGQGSYFMPVPCNHCENAPCVNVCPVAATYHDENGLVLIDHRRCIGCRMCMAACPYQRRFFNWGDPKLPPGAAFAEYSPDYPVPAKKGTTIKCTFCGHFLRIGRLPYCVAGCPMHALYMGDLNEDLASNGVETVQLSKFISDNDGFRNKESLGTQPRVYYLPGHGQASGRTHAADPRPPVPPQWTTGGYDKEIGVWPWEGGK